MNVSIFVIKNKCCFELEKFWDFKKEKNKKIKKPDLVKRNSCCIKNVHLYGINVKDLKKVLVKKNTLKIKNLLFLKTKDLIIQGFALS